MLARPLEVLVALLIFLSRSLLHHLRRHEIYSQPYIDPSPHNSLSRILSGRARIMLYPHTCRSPQAKCANGLPSPALAVVQQSL